MKAYRFPETKNNWSSAPKEENGDEDRLPVALMLTDSHTDAGRVTVGPWERSPHNSSLAPSLVGFQPTVASVVAPLAAVHTHTQSTKRVQSTTTQSQVKWCSQTEYKHVCAPVLVTLPRKMTASCFTDNNITIPFSPE